jgi:RimJ/RimL family protein N-acetyltransferase
MPLTLRKATLADSAILLAWRNDPDVIATSASGRGVTQAEHEAWFIKTLTDCTVHVYLADWLDDYLRVTGCGMGRINEEAGVAVLSYSIAKEWRGQQFGHHLVGALVQQAYELGYTSIQAVSRHSNTASIRALLSQGFQIKQAELLELRHKQKQR